MQRILEGKVGQDGVMMTPGLSEACSCRGEAPGRETPVSWLRNGPAAWAGVQTAI